MNIEAFEPKYFHVCRQKNKSIRNTVDVHFTAYMKYVFCAYDWLQNSIFILWFVFSSYLVKKCILLWSRLRNLNWNFSALKTKRSVFRIPFPVFILESKLNYLRKSPASLPNAKSLRWGNIWEARQLVSFAFVIWNIMATDIDRNFDNDSGLSPCFGLWETWETIIICATLIRVILHPICYTKRAINFPLCTKNVKNVFSTNGKVKQINKTITK